MGEHISLAAILQGKHISLVIYVQGNISWGNTCHCDNETRNPYGIKLTLKAFILL